MVANRAYLWSLLAYADVATVGALPDAIAITREDELVLYVLQQLAITLLVVLLDGCHHLKLDGNLLETFLASFLCHAWIHLCPLVVLAIGSSFQVFLCVLDGTALQVLEPHLGMLLFIDSSLLKDVGNLYVTQKKLRVQTRHLPIYIRCQEETSANGKPAEPMIAIHRRGKGDIWQGLWKPYNASVHEEKGNATEVEIKEQLHFPDVVLQPLARNVKHVLTHRILLADFYLLGTNRRPLLPDDYIWIKESDMKKYGVPRLIEILLEKING